MHNPPDISILQSLIDEDQLTFCPSYSAGREVSIQPVFFYHTPKSGGSTLYLGLRSAMTFGYEFLMKKKSPLIDRVDAELPPRQFLKMPWGLIASHLPYGSHQEFAQDFKLIACLRDPIGRVKSAYGYEMMRNDWLPEQEDFQEFFMDPVHCNVTTRLFAPSQSDNEGANPLQAAQENLSEFYAYAPLSQIDQLLSSLLSDMGLPNVISTHLNPTFDKYRPDYPELDETIIEHNTYDRDLYQTVENHPRFPENWTHLQSTQDLNPYYCLCCGRQTTKGARFHYYFVTEQTLREAIASGNHYATFQEFAVGEILPRSREEELPENLMTDSSGTE